MIPNLVVQRLQKLEPVHVPGQVPGKHIRMPPLSTLAHLQGVSARPIVKIDLHIDYWRDLDSKQLAGERLLVVVHRSENR